MRLCPRCAALLSLFALSTSLTLAQTSAAPSVKSQTTSVKHSAPLHKPAAKPAKSAAVSSPKLPAASKSGTWIQINAHMLGAIGESTWVNLAQASSIRFYQSGKTPFAAVGTGGSNFVSTSDPAEIQKMRAYVQSHQSH